MSNVSITESYVMPSAGSSIYDFTVPETVTLRAMSTLDEKLRLSSTNGTLIIPQLIQRCLVEPTTLDVSKLKMFDVQYLMYMLRVVTYGPEYKLELRCPECGHTFPVTVMLDEIPLREVPEDINEQLTFKLPVSGDTIECQLQTPKDIISMQAEVKRIHNKFPDYEGDPELIVRWFTIIKTINGSTIPKKDLQNYIENMHAKDSAYMQNRYNKAADSVGMDLSRLDVCPECGEEVPYTLAVTTEFFRPSFD